jgi:hypothetical protein
MRKTSLLKCTSLWRSAVAAVSAVWLLVLAGCAAGPSEISSSLSPTANFASYKTIKLENVEQSSGPVFLAVEKAMQDSLSGKGYTIVSKDSDLTLLYKLTIDRGEKLTEEVIPTAQGAIVRHNMEAVNEGKFLVNLVETASGAVAWKASTVKDLSNRTAPLPQDELKLELDRFFESLPAR